MKANGQESEMTVDEHMKEVGTVIADFAKRVLEANNEHIVACFLDFSEYVRAALMRTAEQLGTRGWTVDVSALKEWTWHSGLPGGQNKGA